MDVLASKGFITVNIMSGFIWNKVMFFLWINKCGFIWKVCRCSTDASSKNPKTFLAVFWAFSPHYVIVSPSSHKQLLLYCLLNYWIFQLHSVPSNASKDMRVNSLSAYFDLLCFNPGYVRLDDDDDEWRMVYTAALNKL